MNTCTHSRPHKAVNGSQYQGEAGYASPYCPGYADTSDPWFVQHCRIMDTALLWAAGAAVALLGLSFYMWVIA